MNKDASTRHETARLDLSQLAQRESEQTEWKENVADVDDVVATLCAFANAREPWDRRTRNAATVNDIDLLALRDALQRMGLFTVDRGVEPYLEGGVQLSPFVPSLCVAEPLTGVLRPRNYALLLFGREPQRFISGSFSIFSAYPGLDRSDASARRVEIAGTLLDQARRLQELLDGEAVTGVRRPSSTPPRST